MVTFAPKNLATTLADIVPILKRHKNVDVLKLARFDVAPGGLYVTATDRFVVVVSKVEGSFIGDDFEPFTFNLGLQSMESIKALKTGDQHLNLSENGLTIGGFTFNAESDYDFPHVGKLWDGSASPQDSGEGIDPSYTKHIKGVRYFGEYKGVWHFAAQGRVSGIQTRCGMDGLTGIRDEIADFAKGNL